MSLLHPASRPARLETAADDADLDRGGRQGLEQVDPGPRDGDRQTSHLEAAPACTQDQDRDGWLVNALLWLLWILVFCVALVICLALMAIGALGVIHLITIGYLEVKVAEQQEDAGTDAEEDGHDQRLGRPRTLVQGVSGGVNARVGRFRLHSSRGGGGDVP